MGSNDDDQRHAEESRDGGDKLRAQIGGQRAPVGSETGGPLIEELNPSDAVAATVIISGGFWRCLR